MVVERGAGCVAAELAECPGRMRADERGIVAREGSRECGNGGAVATVAERDSGIAGKPLMLGAFDCPATEA